jgi:hypothetical protein
LTAGLRGLQEQQRRSLSTKEKIVGLKGDSGRELGAGDG